MDYIGYNLHIYVGYAASTKLVDKNSHNLIPSWRSYLHQWYWTAVDRDVADDLRVLIHVFLGTRELDDNFQLWSLGIYALCIWEPNLGSQDQD